MAKVKNPLFSESAHGALGGIEYKAGNYGNVVSRRSISAYKSTPAQQLARSRLARAGAAYKALSPALQAAWNGAAVFPATGRSLYISRWIIMGGIFGLPPSGPISILPFTVPLIHELVIAFPGTRQAYYRVLAPTVFNQRGVIYAYQSQRLSNYVPPGHWKEMARFDHPAVGNLIFCGPLTRRLHIKVVFPAHDSGEIKYVWYGTLDFPP